MKKIILTSILMIINVTSYAETTSKATSTQTSTQAQNSNNYCSISLASQPNLAARKEGGINILSADSDTGIGTSAVINITYTGTPNLTIQSVSTINKTSGNNPLPPITKIITGGKLDNSDNNAKLQSIGGNEFSSGSKTISLSNKNTGTQYITDTLRVKIRAESNKPWSVGNYTANIHINCN